MSNRFDFQNVDLPIGFGAPKKQSPIHSFIGGEGGEAPKPSVLGEKNDEEKYIYEYITIDGVKTKVKRKNKIKFSDL